MFPGDLPFQTVIPSPSPSDLYGLQPVGLSKEETMLIRFVATQHRLCWEHPQAAKFKRDSNEYVSSLQVVLPNNSVR